MTFFFSRSSHRWRSSMVLKLQYEIVRHTAHDWKCIVGWIRRVFAHVHEKKHEMANNRITWRVMIYVYVSSCVVIIRETITATQLRAPSWKREPDTHKDDINVADVTLVSHRATDSSLAFQSPNVCLLFFTSFVASQFSPLSSWLISEPSIFRI